jgi:membrane peptidoglycan carboxypeptidase
VSQEQYTNITTFFKDSGIKTEPKKDFNGSVITVLSNFGKLFLALALTMVLVGIYPLLTLPTSVTLAKPVVEVWKNIPSDLPPVSIAEHNILYDKNGNPFAEIWTEDRIELTSLDSISPFAKQGLIDTEDKRFYDHNGFDVQGTIRAALSGHGGGSGITQQLIKNLQFYNILGQDNKGAATEQSYVRKVKELKMALAYEESHSKDEILLTYFNTVAFGGPNIYGIETASKYFFGKTAKELTLGEAAVLVGSAQNPIIYNLSKTTTAKDWKARQEAVINRLLAEGHITSDQANVGKSEQLKILDTKSAKGNCFSSKYPVYCQYVMDYIQDDPRLGDTPEERTAIISRGGLHISTYLDPEAMDVTNNILKTGFGVNNRIVAPTAIVQPGTGGVLAIAQNREWGSGEGKTTLIVPTIASGEGSAYKIFTLAAALNSGLTENDLQFSSDCPLQPGNKYDAPKNGFKNSSSCKLQGGFLNYKEATAYSSNTWYVTLEMRIGVETVKNFSKTVGLAAPDSMGPRSLAYTLGVVGNSQINVAAALATFSNKGVYCPPTPLTSITYNNGEAIPLPDSYNPANAACKAVMSPHNAGIVLKAMRANLSGEIPNAFGLAANITGYDTVGKSGTNQELNSTWAHLSAQYAIFTNVYDMDKPTNGIDGVLFRGKLRPWHDNTAKLSASDIMRTLLQGKPNILLDYENPDNTFSNIPINESDFFVLPSVIGMSPEEAFTTLQATGITVHVSKMFKPTPEGYQVGTVVEQSIKPGEKLAKGTKKEVTLFLGN